MTKSVMLAERIKAFRRDTLGITQFAMAEKIGVGQANLAHWENSNPDSPGPSTKSLIALAIEAAEAGVWQDANFFLNQTGLGLSTFIDVLLQGKKSQLRDAIMSERTRVRELEFKKITAGEYAGKIGAFEGDQLVGVGDPGDLGEIADARDPAEQLDAAVLSYMSEHKTTRAAALREVSRKQPDLWDRVRRGK